MNHRTVGVMLTEHKRPQLLPEQLEAVRNQSVPPTEVFVWRDAALADKPLGVWPRVLMSQMLPTEYISIMDDDTIPGRCWLENCLHTIDRTGPSVLGTCGQVFFGEDRSQREYFGWKRPMDAPVQVDIVEHSWFFPRELLLGWRDAPYREFPTCGEQFYLSIAAQRLGWRSICPAHPPGDKELWGSLKGMEYGCDEHALWMNPQEEEKKNALYRWARSTNWKLLAENAA